MLLTNLKAKFKTKKAAISFLLGLTLLPGQVYSQTLNPKLSQIASAERSTVSKENSVFVVSDEELKTYSDTAELIRELKVIRQDKETLLDYSKKLRERFKNLETYCAKGQAAKLDSGLEQSCSDSFNLTQQLESLKSDLAKKTQEVQNIKTEYEALKIKFGQVSENYAKLSKDNVDVAKLDSQLKQKSSESKACFEQLDKSQKLVIQIPAMEKELLGLKNELLMRKSAAELLGSNGHLKVDPTKSQELVAKAESKQVEYSNNQEFLKKAVAAPKNNPTNSSTQNTGFGSDVMIVEVVGDKVTLRAGPGPNNSSIMDLAKGARLTVEAREGNWFRVNAPTGGRAYINSGYVRVVDGGPEGGKTKHSFERTKPQKIASSDNDFVGLDVEPVKPPLPEQPVKMNAKKRPKNVPAVPDPVSPDETLALREIRRAMKQNADTGVE